MMFSKLPTSVRIDGIDYPVNSDFRIFVEFDEMIKEPTLTKEQKDFADELLKYPGFDRKKAELLTKYNSGLAIFYQEIPDNLEKAMEKLIWFYQCGDHPEAEGKGGRSQKPIYSFRYDMEYIYAAFLEYGIDLYDIEYLHWWKFFSLFTCLKESSMIVKIMGYRAADLKDMDGEQKKFYKQMKEAYKLPYDDVSKEEREYQDKITQALLNGGDVSSLLKG